MPPFRAVLFDLDGTLLDTLQDLSDSMNRVLEKSGYPQHTMDAYRYFVGDGVLQLVSRALPESARTSETIRKTVEAMRTDYEIHCRDHTKPYDGVPEMLEKLSGAGILLSVLSNKPHPATLEVVYHFFRPGIFRSVYGARPEFPVKPAPQAAVAIANELGLAPSEMLYLGDTDTDMKTAVASGMYPVGALWGFRTGEELLQNGAKTLIAYPSELTALLSLNGGK